MTAEALPEHPVYCFCPVEDPDTGLQQIRIVVDGMDMSIGTSLMVLTADAALAVADKFNRPLGWTRETWTMFATERPRAGSADPGGGAPD